MTRDDGAISRRAVLASAGVLGGGLAGCTAPSDDEQGSHRLWEGTLQTQTPGRRTVDRPVQSRPNVVVIYADDLGWLDLGFQGSEYYDTPNIDALAASGTSFRAGYANAPNCAPSRACLLTGQYTPRHGVYTVRNPDEVNPRSRRMDPPPNNLVLPTDHTTIAEVLSAAGYATGFVGKWHVGEAGSEHGPLARGFDSNVGGGIYGKVPSGYFPPYDLPNLDDGGDQYLTDRLTDHAVDFVETHADGPDPFFLLYSTYSVHTPLQAPQSDIEPYRDRECWQGQCNPTYGGMVAALDRAVGRITDTLAELGLTEETLVVFSSDNGGVGDYGEVGLRGDWSDITSMGPLRGGKGTLYEGGIRVPMVTSWPSVIPSRRLDTPVAGTDIFSTVVELAEAGEAVPDDHPVDGRSLADLLGGGDAPERKALFWHFPSYLTGDGSGAYRTTPVSVVRKGPWKLLYYYEDRRTELYDLSTDRSETTNLAADRPERRDRLLDRLRTWKQRVGARNPRRR